MCDTAEGRFAIRDDELRLDVPDSRVRRTVNRLRTTPTTLRWLFYLPVSVFALLSLYAVVSYGVAKTIDLLVFVAVMVSPLAFVAVVVFVIVALAVAFRSGRTFGLQPFTSLGYPERIPLDRITDVSSTTQVNGEETILVRYEDDDGEEATVLLSFNRWMEEEWRAARAAFDEHGLEIAEQ